MLKRLLAKVRSRISDVPAWRRIVAIPVLVLSLGYLGYKVYTSWDALRNYN